MKPKLKPILARTMELFRADDRVLAAYHGGSVATGQDDDLSDVDPVLLVRAEAPHAFDRDLPALFRAAGVEPLLWWPERINSETFCNYAVMFHQDGTLLQYDINIQAWGEGRLRVPAGAVIFDKAGILEAAEQAATPPFDPARLAWTIEMYWIYVYIHCKYLLRGDRFRLAAAQHELLQAHLHVLHALRPEEPADWWPILAARVAEGASEETLLSYLSEPTAEAVAERLPQQVARFGEDARRACERWGKLYPVAFEEAVLEEMRGVIGRLGPRPAV